MSLNLERGMLITTGIMAAGAIAYVIYKKQVPKYSGKDSDKSEYLNFSLTRADAGDESEKQYQEAKTRFPKPPTCEKLKNVIDQVALEILAAQKQRATSMSGKGSGRPELYRINGYSRWKTELEQNFANLNCTKLLEQKEQQEVFGTFASQLETAKAGTEKSDQMTTYIVFGMLGVVLLASGLLILRK